jgi:hypothetical protein
MMAPADASTIVALGDLITDGTASTMNGDDRWPDVLARRLHVIYATSAVVNAGIGGNQVVGPTRYSPQEPFPGGPSAKDRLDRDVLSLSGVSAPNANQDRRSGPPRGRIRSSSILAIPLGS